MFFLTVQVVIFLNVCFNIVDLRMNYNDINMSELGSSQNGKNCM